MLSKLTYSVTFPTTGRSFNETVHFQGGFGAITGPNEAGKSLIIEMIRWLLFGSAALRGNTSDYKDLSGELEVTIKGVAYRIKRTINSAKIFRGDEELAVGIRPVNNKVVELLGFGLDVFDISSVANQDELLRLGTMKPTERKRMVDSVIGLGVLEDLAKSAGEEASNFNRRAEDLLDTISEPTEPTKPEDYEPSEQVAEKRQKLLEAKSEYDQLQGWLSTGPQAPTAPEEKIPLDSETLMSLMESQGTIRAERQALEAQLALLPNPSIYTEKELDEFEGQALLHSQAMRKARFLNQYQQPQYTQEQLDDFEKANEIWKIIQERKRLEERIEHLKSCGKNSCPSCGHEWALEQEQIEELEKKINLLPDTPNIGPAVLDPGQILLERRRWQTWLSVQDEWNEIRDFPDEAPKPKLSIEQIDEARRANAAAGQRAELVSKIEALNATLAKQPDYATMLVQRQRFEAEMVAYQSAVEAYMAYQQERQVKQGRFKQLEQELKELPAVNDLYERCRVYEYQMQTYQEAKERYDDVTATAADFKKQSEEWKKVKVALTELRSMVKQHLVPSLNKVASHLLKQMTGGQRQKIEVDEDFNILVDDQGIDTLSGSGKAVANLALRLGLGQVLTNNVFSVFMGDEIDASMDADRAQNTTNTLQTLMRKISQILLVTHKYPLADYYITLGNNSEQAIQ